MSGDPALASVYVYPAAAHVRRHGPRGYTDYTSYKPWLRDEFAFRCVYCLWRERWELNGDAVFSIDHVVPQSEAPERVCDYENLAYACTACNSAKRDQRLLDPCLQGFGAHLRIREDGTAEAFTLSGQRMIEILNLNRARATEFRRRLLETLVRITRAESGGPNELLRRWLGHPDDLPELAALRPPHGNSRPAGVEQSGHARRQRHELPAVY